MTEEEARQRLRDTVPRETFSKLEVFADIIAAERLRQNLISENSAAAFWARHLLDSAQLAWLEATSEGHWLDIGSGAGLPGIVIAILRDAPITLVEPRARRAAFLRDAVADLRLGHARIILGRVERAIIEPTAEIVSARAVASLNDLFAMAERHTSQDTLWLMPKGRSAATEVAAARTTWQGEMRLVPSLSEPTASIVVARNIRRKNAR